MEANYVGYVRASTEEQGRSGLGLEARREALAKVAGTPLKILEDIMSGAQASQA